MAQAVLDLTFEDDLEFVILLPPWPLYVVLGIEVLASCLLAKHSASALDLFFFPFFFCLNTQCVFCLHVCKWTQ